MPVQFPQIGQRERPHFRLQISVSANNARTESRQLRAAAATPAGAGAGDGLTEVDVHIRQQEPCSSIAHADPACGLRQRAGASDCLQQFDLPNTNGAIPAKIHAKPHRWGLSHTDSAPSNSSDRPMSVPPQCVAQWALSKATISVSASPASAQIPRAPIDPLHHATRSRPRSTRTVTAQNRGRTRGAEAKVEVPMGHRAPAPRHDCACDRSICQAGAEIMEAQIGMGFDNTGSYVSGRIVVIRGMTRAMAGSATENREQRAHRPQIGDHRPPTSQVTVLSDLTIVTIAGSNTMRLPRLSVSARSEERALRRASRDPGCRMTAGSALVVSGRVFRSAP